MSTTYVDYGDISGQDPDSRNARKNAQFVKVGASITKIFDNAFQNSNIEEIIFEEGSQLESIGERAFNHCKNLKSMTIPASVRTINMNTFSHSALERIDFACDTLEAIGWDSFKGCKFLKSIVIPASVTVIGYGSFSDSGLEEVSFTGESKLQLIGPYAFANCKFLKSITIPDSVDRIDLGAFFASTLEEFLCTDNSNLKAIGIDVFKDCNSLKIIKLPSKSVKIGNNLFCQSSSLEEIIFGDCKLSQTRDKYEYFVQLCQEGDVTKCKEYLNNNISLQYKLLNNYDKSKSALDVAISTKNTALCLLLIKHNAHVNSHHSLYSIYHSLQDESIFQALDNPAQLLKVVCSALLSKYKNYDIAYNLLQKLKLNLDLGIWSVSFEKSTHYDTEILRPILQSNSLKLYQAYVDCGFSVNHANLEHFLSTRNKGNIYDQVLNQFLPTLVSLDIITLKKCYNLALKYGNADIFKNTLELLLKVDPSFPVNLTKDVLFSIPHSNLDSIIPLLLPYITTFGIIKEAEYDEEQCCKYYPETLLSYLAFTKSFVAFKAVIESPTTTTSLQPTHLVACSLFRGYYTSKFYKHSTETYDDIFDYLMRDDVRPRVLGSGCEWVDKSIFNCIRYGNERMVIKLLNLGADLSNIFVHRICGNSHDTLSRFTLLSYACKYQGITLVKELVERGIPVNGTMIDILGEDKITDTNKDVLFTMNDDIDIEGEEDADNGNNVENDWDCDDGDDGDNGDDGDDGDDVDEAPESGTVGKTSSEKYFQFFYTRDEIRRTVGNNPWFLPYFCRKTMNRNKDIPDYNGEYEFTEHLYLLSMTPLGVAIHHEKVELISFLLERGADPNSTPMDIPTIYNITTTIMGEFCTAYDSCQETDHEFKHYYGVSEELATDAELRSKPKSDDITAKEGFDGLQDILLEKDEYSYDENWETQLVCYIHQYQPQNEILALNHVDTKHVDTKHGDTKHGDTKHNQNNNNTMNDRNITITVPNPSHLTFKSTPGKIISLLLQYGLDIISLIKSEIKIKHDSMSLNDNYWFNFDSILDGFLYDVDLLFLLKNYVTPEVMKGYVSKFLAHYYKGLTYAEFYHSLILLLQYGLVEVGGKEEDIIIANLSHHIAEKSVIFTQFIGAGIISKETLRNELAEVMTDFVWFYFPSFIKYTKLYPDLFSITFETMKGITLLLGNDIVSKYKLLQLGLNINHRTKAGDTLLLHSLKCKMEGSFRVLLSLGADTHLVDQDGTSIEELLMLGRVDCLPSTKIVFENHLHLLTLLVKMNTYQDNLCICGDVRCGGDRQGDDKQKDDKQMDEMVDGKREGDDNSYNCDSSHSVHAHVHVQSTSVQPSPFTVDECALIQSSHIPGYTAQTLSYFLSKSIVDNIDIVCMYCHNKFKANDHCRPMLMRVDDSNNVEEVEKAEDVEEEDKEEEEEEEEEDEEKEEDVGKEEKFIHNICFHKSNLQDPNIWTKTLKDSICYIVNPTKPLTPKYI